MVKLHATWLKMQDMKDMKDKLQGYEATVCGGERLNTCKILFSQDAR